MNARLCFLLRVGMNKPNKFVCHLFIQMFSETHQPPQFTTEIVDQRVQEGESATFECYFAGNPKPGNKRVVQEFIKD